MKREGRGCDILYTIAVIQPGTCPTMSQQLNPERAFLHDISSPLTTVQLNLENIVAVLEEGKPEEQADCVRMLNSCLSQVRRAAEMIRARREVLVKASETK